MKQLCDAIEDWHVGHETYRLVCVLPAGHDGEHLAAHLQPREEVDQ